MILKNEKFHELQLKEYTFTEVLRAHGDTYGNDHIVYTADNIDVSCRDLRDRTDAMAARFIKNFGLKPGDRVSLIMNNSVDWLPCFFAVIRAGGTVIVENPLLSGEEIIKHYEDIDLKYLLVGGITEQFEGDIRNFFGEKVIKAAELAVNVTSDEEKTMLDEMEDRLQKRRGAVGFFTSGSTSKPKLVILSQEALALNAYHMVQRTEHRTDAELICVSLSHIMGLVPALHLIIAGLYFVLTDNRIEKIIDACRDKPMQLLQNAPIVIKMLIKHPEFESVIKPGAEIIILGSAPSTPEEGHELERAYEADILNGYGLTEAGGIVCMPRLDAPEDKRFKTVGQALEGIDLRIEKLTDDSGSGSFCVPGEIGEVLVGGDCLMNGYASIDGTEEVIIDEEGYLHTGDLGYLDEDGYLILCGRKKNIIIKGGENIMPGEIEACISGLESVDSVVVLGVPDEKYGEEIAAFVVPRQGFTISSEEVQDAVGKVHTRFKQPRYVFQYDALPLNKNGKPDLIRLREDALHSFES